MAGAFPRPRRAARPARHRPLHGGRHRGDRLRPARRRGRRQCRAGDRAALRDRGAAAAAPRRRSAGLDEALPPRRAPGDFAQAMMDLGATICTPRKPACVLCPLARRLPRPARRQSSRAAAQGAEGAAAPASRLSRSGWCATTARCCCAAAPTRACSAAWLEVPGSDWSAGYDQAAVIAVAPMPADWRRLPGSVEHVFTHFALRLTVFAAETTRPTRRRGCVSSPRETSTGRRCQR